MNFFEQHLITKLYEQVTTLGWSTPSNIQTEVIPHALLGKDILAIAPTGSGKTGAYLLPVLNSLQVNTKKKHKPQILIMTPTRELARQVAEVTRSLLENQEGIRTYVLTGGVDMNKQVRGFSKGADIVIGTPSRLKDHLRRHTLKVDEIRTLILDEADEMLSMGFVEDVNDVIHALPPHQTMLFSATFDERIKDLAMHSLINPVKIELHEDAILARNMDLKVIIVNAFKKLDTLKEIIDKHSKQQVLVFCNTKKTSDFVSERMNGQNISSKSLHSDMDPRTRIDILNKFKQNEIKVLCATDVAARGIDIPTVDLVVLYDYPDRSEFLVHRIGRTGRANLFGTAIILLKPHERKIEEIQRLSQLSFTVEDRGIRTKKHQHTGEKKRRKR